ncbi:hypothetical protein QFC19_001645 [Naganishia cerealis]|uniref:Uncharacterized protein n=1 Tax=Naganishia cerealis TaxID=610337 RepID=A0ACC2WF09_9TREE|nr:hypothetical protein QFC19_001645 [Naganishia cerealis]
MERPRYWTKQLKLPCALEHAVLRTRVFRRPEAWTPSFFQKALAIQGDLKPGCEIENGLVFPLEDPLLVASDRIRKHYDEVDEGATFPRCWAKLVKTHDLFQKEDDNDEVETLMIAHSIPQDSSRAGDSLAVFEVSDGVLTETGSLLSGIELRGTFRRTSPTASSNATSYLEVFDRCIKLLDVLTCPCHNQTHCSGCRGRYRLDTQSQPIPIPPYSTDLGEIELFNGIEEEGIPLTAKAIWNNFALALIDYYAYIEDWLPELVSARSFNLQ